MAPHTVPDPADDLLMSALSPKDLLSFAQTSRDHHGRVDAYMRRASNMEKFLGKYFTVPQVEHFRYLQSCTQTVISGSTALQFFERVEYPDSDLDLYVEHRHKEKIIGWLLRIGYVFESRRNTTLAQEMNCPPVVEGTTTVDHAPTFNYFGRGVANVYNFYKYNPERKIQVIASRQSTLEVILNYHSTCVMNIITHEKAYALYPKATFMDRRSVKYSTLGINQEGARQKYTNRGWTMIEHLSAGELQDPSSEFMAGVRHVGDRFCWTVDLLPKMKTTMAITVPESLVESNSWEFRCREGSAYMITKHLVDEKLSFVYLFGDKETREFVVQALAANNSESAGQLDAAVLALVQTRRVPS